MKEGSGGAGTLLGEKNPKEFTVWEKSCFTKLKYVHKTPEGEHVFVSKDSQSEGGSEWGLSVFNILDLCWKISKTDARISFECIWVLTGLAGRLAGTCCWPITVPILIIMLAHSTLSACSVANLLCLFSCVCFIISLIFHITLFLFVLFSPEVKCA